MADLSRPRILIVGVGGIGARHLQGVLSVTKPLEIHLLDPSREQIELALTLQGAPGLQGHQVFSHQDPSSLPKSFAIAISATTSRPRISSALEVSRNRTIEHWILEKLVITDRKISDQMGQLAGRSTAWINTPRRLMPLYQALRERLLDRCGPIEMTVSGSRWGLVSNAVHFLDVLQFLSGGEVVDVKAAFRGRPYMSKRQGYFDVQGTIGSVFSDGSTVRIQDVDRFGQNDLGISLKVDGSAWVVTETQNRALNVQLGSEIVGAFLLQSEMTGPIVESLLQKEEIGLPQWFSVSDIHEKYLAAALDAWPMSNGVIIQVLPVT